MQATPRTYELFKDRYKDEDLSSSLDPDNRLYKVLKLLFHYQLDCEKRLVVTGQAKVSSPSFNDSVQTRLDRQT